MVVSGCSIDIATDLAAMQPTIDFLRALAGEEKEVAGTAVGAEIGNRRGRGR